MRHSTWKYFIKIFYKLYNSILCTEAVEYEQFDCLGTYDILSKIGKRKREFVCRGAKVKLRLIVLHSEKKMVRLIK